MKKIYHHVEEMRVQLAEASTSELALIRSLSDALRRIDDKLLSELRNVTVEHESRRAAIMGEVLTLAGRLCALPEPQQAAPAAGSIEHARYARVATPAAGDDAVIVNGGAGDWRQAARNIEDDLEFPFGSHMPN
jgi:hypothetical protein